MQVLDSVPKRALSGYEDGAPAPSSMSAGASPRPSTVHRPASEEAASAHEGPEVALQATPAAGVAGTSSSTVGLSPDRASASQQQRHTHEDRSGS